MGSIKYCSLNMTVVHTDSQHLWLPAQDQTEKFSSMERRRTLKVSLPTEELLAVDCTEGSQVSHSPVYDSTFMQIWADYLGSVCNCLTFLFL